jgi:hypothetical protein
MKKSIFIVSYTSCYEEIYNNVNLFTNKEDAIKSANSYVEEVNERVKPLDKNKDFSEYENGYKEITIKDHFRGSEFLISITEFNNVK